MIIVSACLAGINCRYNGKNSQSRQICKMASSGKALPVCPEQLGGLPTPRAPSEIRGGEGADVIAGKAGVFDSNGADMTAAYLRGAREVLKIAELTSAREAVLKDGSPACSCRFISSGGKRVKGAGVCAAMLKSNGIKVFSSGEM